MLKKIRKKLVFFLEVCLPYVITIFFVLLLIANLFSQQYDFFPFNLFENIKIFLFEDLYPKMRDKDGILITVSAVFIGIYFTIFSLLGNIREDSTLNVLKEKHFKKLLNYIFFAFLSSFAYLFLSLFSNLKADNIYFKSVSLCLLIYMFYSAMRFGTIMFYSYRKDFKDFKIRLEKQQVEDIKFKNAVLKIEKYIDEINKEKQKEKNKNLNK